MGTRGQSANPVLEPLFRSVRANHPKADLALLERAYVTAEKMHGTQTRKSGDPYITHPLAVTTILADIGMTESTLAAALLHDTVEDTPYTLDQVRQDRDSVPVDAKSVCQSKPGPLIRISRSSKPWRRAAARIASPASSTSRGASPCST